MYARDISRKVKAAKHQQAKDGKFIGAQAPFGYQKKNHQLVIDPEAADVVRQIYEMASSGHSEIEICRQLEADRVLTPCTYKLMHGDKRFSRYCENSYQWRTSTIQRILTDTVYLGTLTSLRTETKNYKSKQRKSAPREQWIVTENAHEAIITRKQFEDAKSARSDHFCVAMQQRENLFRGLLFCDGCGHPLSIAHRKLTYKEDDIYRCSYHFRHPEICPRTHAIYHSMLKRNACGTKQTLYIKICLWQWKRGLEKRYNNAHSFDLKRPKWVCLFDVYCTCNLVIMISYYF